MAAAMGLGPQNSALPRPTTCSYQHVKASQKMAAWCMVHMPSQAFIQAVALAGMVVGCSQPQQDRCREQRQPGFGISLKRGLCTCKMLCKGTT